MIEDGAKIESWVNRTVWMDGCDIETELRQAKDEGRDLRGVEGEFDSLLSVPRPANGAFLGGGRDETWLKRAGALVDKVQTLPIRADYAYREPDGLEAIRAARP
ncbi:MAG TPA: hypothetical protein VFW40_09540, partial [Capsulimonadaceae bacterium]|nr:hypothetical protein [Capsulimonadaceae bacterium]